MNSNKKNFFNKSNFLNFILLSPFIFAVPFFDFNNQVKAAIEYQWDDNPNFKRLKWFQKNNAKQARNSIFFFLRPRDRNADLLKVRMIIPKSFKTTLNKEKISLCQVRIGGFDSRTKCIKEIPADIEINEDKTSLEIFPYTPIPLNKKSYSVVFKIFNPTVSDIM